MGAAVTTTRTEAPGTNTAAAALTVTIDDLRRQLTEVYRAWGMGEAHIETTVEMMLYADIHGIDSHGVGMLPLYSQWRGEYQLNMRPEIATVREGPAIAVLDGDAGLGHAAAHAAMGLAMEKAKSIGLGAVAVRNSAHFGAAGAYAMLAAEAGLIGIATTSAHHEIIVPTFSAQAMFGTNPIAFAAPAGRNRPFSLDMATSTVAVGKIVIAQRHGRPIPEGWASDGGGRPTTDPDVALENYMLSPLGGTRELGSHKGYGLAAMVEILSTMLSGAIYTGTKAARRPDAVHPGVGHFMLAMDPGAFREFGDFEDDMDDMIDALRANRPVDPAQKVMVAGDPEYRAAEERRRSGVPLPAMLVGELRAIVAECGAPYVLEG
jgi:LDH2 family malate/lactate/ureidoglycolate dehydrogenase